MAFDRAAGFELIRSNIEQYGYHTYGISGGSSPMYHYSIGLSPRLGAELIIAGASYFSPHQQLVVIKELSSLPERLDARGPKHTVRMEWGDFEVAPAHPSWAGQLALGVYDYYQRDVALWSITPTGDARTIDVPDMTVPWQAGARSAWRWIGEKWPYKIPEYACVVTDLRAMRGEAVTDGLRRTETDWELFVDADPDQPQEEVFVVPFGTLLGCDPTLAAFTRLAVGEGLTRKPGELWMTRRTRH